MFVAKKGADIVTIASELSDGVSFRSGASHIDLLHTHDKHWTSQCHRWRHVIASPVVAISTAVGTVTMGIA